MTLGNPFSMAVKSGQNVCGRLLFVGERSKVKMTSQDGVEM